MINKQNRVHQSIFTVSVSALSHLVEIDTKMIRDLEAIWKDRCRFPHNASLDESEDWAPQQHYDRLHAICI